MKIQKQATRRRMGYVTILEEDISKKFSGRWPPWEKQTGSLTFDLEGGEKGKKYTYTITLSGAEICALVSGALRKATDVDTQQMVGEAFVAFFSQLLRPQPVEKKT